VERAGGLCYEEGAIVGSVVEEISDQTRAMIISGNDI
jgi:hypothetical protein